MKLRNQLHTCTDKGCTSSKAGAKVSVFVETCKKSGNYFSLRAYVRIIYNV